MSILGKIKKGVASSGSNKGKLLYFKPDSKLRVRFLQEIEDGLEVTMHDSFDRGINVVCRKHFGEDCDHCEDETLRTRSAYVWSVWDHDAKEEKLFVGHANNFSPLPNLVAMYEAYGTIMDRDYVIQQNGSGTSKTFGVVPMDKAKFKNSKAKAYSAKKTLSILDKAFPSDATEEDDDDDEDDKPVKKGKKGKGKPAPDKKKKKKKPDPEPEEDEDEDDEEEENEYSEMSPKELYLECVERGLKAKKKQEEDYYIDMLMEDDLENEDDEDDDSDKDDEDADW